MFLYARQCITKVSFGPEVIETYIDFFTPPRSATGIFGWLTPRACWQFLDWCAAHGLELTLGQP